MSDEPTRDAEDMTTCVGCGLRLPKTGGPAHSYIVSSPECWAVYGQVLAREYQNATIFSAVHQLTVDAYAVHHPTDQPPKSLVSHLVSLYTTVELGLPQVEGREALLRFVRGRKGFPSLEPPDDLGPLTVLDVLEAEEHATHIETVRRWAEQLWNAWNPHRELIASFVKASSPHLCNP